MAITIGATTEIDASGSADLDICKLTDTLAIALYGGGASDPSKWYARTVSISGSTLTPNAEVLVDSTSFDSTSECAIVPLTSTSAMVIYSNSGFSWRVGARVLTVSGTTITVNAETALTDDPRGTNSFDAAALSSTSVIYTYKKLSGPNDGFARILSVSGTTITENAAHQITSNQQYSSPVVVALTSSKAIISWIDTRSGTGTEDVLARVVTVSGTTISSNPADNATVDSGTGHTTVVDTVAMAMLTGTTVAHVHRDWSSASELRAHILTISGTSTSVGSVLIVNTAAFQNMHIAALTSTAFATHCDTGANFRVSQFSVSGTTVTLVDEEVGEVSVNSLSAIAALASDKAIAAFQGSVDGYIITFTGTGISGSEFTSGLLTARPADIDMDGSFIYIGALASDGTPILIKFATALNADGSIVFQPGAGTDIGVQCGRKDADVIWIAGNFGGTDTVEKSEDAGASFTVKDDGSFDPVTSFAVGPDSDERVLIFTDAGGSVASTSIYETIDDGASWEQKNSGLGFVSKVVERLDINVEELVTGNESSVTDNIDYSPNSGEDLEDYSTGFPEVDVTSLVVG